MNRHRGLIVAFAPTAVCAALVLACGGTNARCIGGNDWSCDDGGVTTSDAAPDAGPDVSTNDGGPTFGDSSVSDGPPACTALNIGILGTLGNSTTSNFLQWLENAGTSVTQLQMNPTDPPLATSTLAQFDVVILSKLARAYAPSEATVLRDRIATGGGLISLSGFMLDWYSPSYTNDLLQPFSLAYAGNLFDGPITSFAVHPMTQGLTSVSFVGGYAIQDLGLGGSARTAIAFQPNTSNPAGYAVELGQGRGFVWGDEWIEYDSEWSSNAEIKQLWVDVFGWVAPKGCALVPQ